MLFFLSLLEVEELRKSFGELHSIGVVCASVAVLTESSKVLEENCFQFSEVYSEIIAIPFCWKMFFLVKCYLPLEYMFRVLDECLRDFDQN